MLSVRELIKWRLALGGDQVFLGARWISNMLARTPESKKFSRALWLLSFSPHYFHLRDAPEYSQMSDAEYRRHFFEESRSSREKIHTELFENMDLGKVVVDYGCGPGYLARVLARKAEKVIACDISSGTVACASAINPADNLVYVTADEKGLSAIPDGSVDSVVSINMVQHLKIAAYRKVLSFMSKMLKPGGNLVMHIQLSDPDWKTEEEWRSDKSVRGRMKFEFGIHCFSISEEMHKSLVAEYGFGEITVKPVAAYTDHHFADIGDQHMLIAKRL